MAGSTLATATGADDSTPTPQPTSIASAAITASRREMVRFILLSIQLDTEFFELFRFDRSGRASHQIACPLRFGESNTIANVVQATKQHHPAVNSQRNPAVRRRAVLQRPQ